MAVWWATEGLGTATATSNERAMRSITLRNYRCIGDEPQTARLAPLTLLVGENSSGKTSLMAMVRALWDIAYDNRVPDFKQGPYDLGSFDEIAHHRGARGGRAKSFEAEFETDSTGGKRNGASEGPLRFRATFEAQWSAPTVISRQLERGGYWLTHDISDGESECVEVRTPRGRWRCQTLASRQPVRAAAASEALSPIESLLFRLQFALHEGIRDHWKIEPLDGAAELNDTEVTRLIQALSLPGSRHRGVRHARDARPFASAPVRSQPKRTYDPVRVYSDAFGDNVPTYLAQLALREPASWAELKKRLEAFGRDAELFDEIRVRRLGQTDVDPFQVQVRKFGKGVKGPYRNLVDVGYGISQVLPVVTEMLRVGGSNTLLLQQPEVHLHPSAQAALGSLLCQMVLASRRRQTKQLIVETHSDFIIDRVRMAVADERHDLNPADVSIVYFERRGLDSRLHSISVDRLGNVEGAPQGYRQFFLEELQRSVGF